MPHRMHAVIKASPAAIIALDLDNTIELWNPAAERIFGWSEDEILGEHIPIIPDERMSESDELLERLYETGRVEGVETKRLRKDGTLVDVRISAAPIRTPDDVIIGAMGVYDDITEAKRYERQFESIVENTTDAVFIKDLEGRYQFMNEAGANLFGNPVDEVIGATDADFFDPETAATVMADDQHIIETGDFLTTDTLVTIDGTEHLFLEKKYPFRDSDGEIVGVMGISRDITHRMEYEREIMEANERLHTVISNAPLLVFGVDADGIITMLEGRLIESLPPGTVPVVGDPLLTREEFRAIDADPRIADDFRRALAGHRVNATREYAGLTVDMTLEPIILEGEVIGVTGISFDVSDVVQRERALDTIHTTANDLLDATTADDAGDVLVESAASLLDDGCAVLYLLDAEATALGPASTDGETAENLDPVPVGTSENPLWSCYANGVTASFDEHPVLDAISPGFETGLVVPVGDHGVLLLLESGHLPEDTLQFGETLAATAETAFDHLESVAALDDREATLARKTRDLEHQVHVTDVIRRLSQVLIGATSRAEIERTICEALVDDEKIDFAWIASLDASGTELVEHTWAGDGETYIDAVRHEFGPDTTEPAVEAARQDTPVVVSNVVDYLQTSDWAKRALDSGFRSIVSVPLVVDEYGYGVLAAYAGEANVFGDLDRDVFRELGEQIADDIATVQTRNALFAGRWDELTLDITNGSDFLSRLARAADIEVEYAGLATLADDEARLFVRTDPEAVDAIESSLAESSVVISYQRIDPTGDQALYEVTVSSAPLLSRLVTHGGSPQSIRATPTGTEVVVDVPTATDVREFVSMLRDVDSSVELNSRHTVERSLPAGGTLAADLFDALTERQVEVLRTAFLAGFYEWPRQSTGEDIADILGVSQPTVNRHLRVGTRRLLAQLFETAPPPVELE